MWLELGMAILFLIWKRSIEYNDKPHDSLDYHPLYGLPGKVDKYQGHRMETGWPQRTHPDISRFEPQSIVNTPQYAQKYVEHKHDVVFENKNVFMDDTYVDLSQRPKSRHISLI